MEIAAWIMETLTLSEHAKHDIAGFLMCLALLVVYDLAFCLRRPGRWFKCHAFANLITVVFSLRAMLQWAIHPLSVSTPIGQEAPDPLGPNGLDPEVLLHANNDWAILMILAVHTYHCIGFNLSKQDIFHHFMFVPTIGVGGGFLIPWGPVRNCLCFFISGFPGGVDYVMLVLLKNGMTDKLTCKRLSAAINVWIRGPGCGVLVPATIYASWTEGRLMPGTNPMWGFVVAVFAAYNGLYYMEMSVKNYQMHLTRTMMQESHTDEIRKLKETWKSTEEMSVQKPGPPTGAGTPEPIRKALSMLIGDAQPSGTSGAKKDS